MKNRNRYYLDTKTDDLVLVNWWVTNGIESGGSARVMRLRDNIFYTVSYANEEEETKRLRGPLTPLEVLAHSAVK